MINESEINKLELELTTKSNELKQFFTEKKLQILKLDTEIKKRESQLKEVATYIQARLSKKIDTILFTNFLKKPYKIKRISEKKYEIYVPKWVPDFQIGWLTDDDGDWLTYEVNQFSAWLGDIPDDIAEKLKLTNDFKPNIDGKIVYFESDQKPKAQELFKGHILSWSEDHAVIKSDHEFDIILQIIRSGHIPYKQIPIDPTDRRKSQINFTPRPYQQEALKKFEKTGAIGVFHPTGAGKSFVAMAGADILTGPKLLVTKKTLIDQWRAYFEKYAPRLLDEVEIVTYELVRSRPEYLKKQYVIVIFDECHRLPANSFAKLSLLQCKYRMGLSASPHREDGREDMIIALTGYPTGLNWQKYMEETKTSYHPIHIHLVKSKQQKISKIKKLLDVTKKTIIFSDYIEDGENIAKQLSIPFISGQTENRMQVLHDNKVIVGSRVLDEGISVSDLQRIIEVEFLYGSKQQEIQRTGRLMHSLKAERHDIIMTEKEFESYGKRIWILQDKGFHVKVHEVESR